MRVKTARKRSHSSALWLERQLNDPFVVEAKKVGFRSRVDGMMLGFTEILRIIRELVGMDAIARAAQPCIGAGRADLMLAGCAILQAICSVWPVGRLRVADRGVREGILSGLMEDARRAERAPDLGACLTGLALPT